MAQERSRSAGSETSVSQEEAGEAGRGDEAGAPSAADDAGQEVVPQGNDWKGFATALASRLDDVFGADDAAADVPASRQEVPVEERLERAVGHRGQTPARSDASPLSGTPRIGFDTEYELAVQRLAGIDPEVLVQGAATLRPREVKSAPSSGELAPDVPQVVRIDPTERDTQGVQGASNVETDGQPRAVSGRSPVRWIAAGLLLLAVGAAALLLNF